MMLTSRKQHCDCLNPTSSRAGCCTGTRNVYVLREGMVFAFEPKFIFPGEGAVGIEVDFIVRKDRLERVTDYPVDVMYLE